MVCAGAEDLLTDVRESDRLWTAADRLLDAPDLTVEGREADLVCVGAEDLLTEVRESDRL